MKLPPVKSWKTTASGVVFAASVFVSMSGFELPTWAAKTLKGMQGVSIAVLGSTAKDYNVTGDPPKEVKHD